jgi:hypothetical protein
MAKPDLSGTWRFNHAKSTLQIPAPDETIFIIDHRDPVLRLTRTHVSGESRDTFSIDLTTDGAEVTAERGDLQLVSYGSWDGEVLVFDTRLRRGGVEGTNIVRYTLAPDGRSITADERFRSEAMNYDNVWVLEKA